jgi:hypothetical protein
MSSWVKSLVLQGGKAIGRGGFEITNTITTGGAMIGMHTSSEEDVDELEYHVRGRNPVQETCTWRHGTGIVVFKPIDEVW